MKTLGIVFLILIGSMQKSYAVTQEDSLHIMAHFGATYIITHVTEVTCVHLTSKKQKLACTLVGAGLANGINIGRKIRQGVPSDTQRAVVSGIAGSLVAGIVISLDW